MATISKSERETLARLPELQLERWSTPIVLDNGISVRAKLEYDTDTRLEEEDDWFGSIHWPERHSERSRPSKCNGAARKIDTRNGPVWWQPPADVVREPDALKSLEARVRGYFREEWTYVGVIVEVTAPTCSQCGERKKVQKSLWGVESDVSDYHAEVVADLVEEAICAEVPADA